MLNTMLGQEAMFIAIPYQLPVESAGCLPDRQPQNEAENVQPLIKV
jgi:hypothetical protein